jgi:hypothetical protein
MSVINSARAETGVELLITTLTGGVDLIGTLLNNPVVIFFDNQSTVAIKIYHNQTTDVWHTFPAGEALTLDMRTNKGNAADFTFSVGDTFYAQGSAGANQFSISYIYARNV